MNASSASAPRHQSTLATSRDRFLAAVLHYAGSEGWRTPDDFLRHFGPRILVNALASDDALRVRLLVATTRVNERLAMRKTAASAAEDLALALDEGLTTPAKILALLPVDDRVRYLDATKLWAFLSEVEFWKGDVSDPEQRDRFIQRVTFLIEAALREGVLRLQDVADGIGFKRIANCLPRAELQRVVEHALSRARDGHQLSEEQLLEAVSLRSLMHHVPLEHIWSEVVLGRLARPLQLIRSAPEEAPRSRRLPPPPPSRGKPSSKPARFDPSLLPESLLELQRGLEQSEPPSSSEEHLADLVAVSADDSEATQIHVEVSTRVDVKAHRDEPSAPESGSAELDRVLTALQRIGRLPPADPELTLPILLSIESMYAELSHAMDEGARYSVVRDAFPNENHLRTALIALIRMLDPRAHSSDGGLSNAGADSLIRTFSFAEQHAREASSTETNHDADGSFLLRPPAGQYS